MTNSVAILSVLTNFPAQVQNDAAFRAALVLAQKLAAQLGTSGTGNNAALIAGDFLEAQLDDPWIVAKYREKLNFLAERHARAS